MKFSFRGMLIGAAALAAAAILPFSALAAEYYVSADGSDSNAGTQSAPVATLAKVAALANATSDPTVDIYVMSDLTSTACARFYDKNVTLQSQGGPYTVTRGTGFSTQSDTGRGWYNPAMIEIQTVGKQDSISLLVTNITLDDNNINLADKKATGNLKNAQSSILESTPYKPIKSTITLGEGAVLKNAAGSAAIYLENDSTFVMLAGSKIIDSKPTSAVINLTGASCDLRQGSEITGVTSGNIILVNGGNVTIDNNIHDNDVHNGSRHIVQTGSTGNKVIINKNATIDNNKVGYGAIYLNADNEEVYMYGKIRNNAASDRCGGIVLSNNGGFGKKGWMYDGAVISGNTCKDGGAGLMISKGEFVMEGGEVTGNSVITGTGVGGGVHVRRGGIFTMNGGKISGNTALTYGGGIAFEATYYGQAPSVTLNGGTITGNTDKNGSNDLAIITTNAANYNKSNQGYGYSDSYLVNKATVGDMKIYFQTDDYYLEAPKNVKLGNASSEGRNVLYGAAEQMGWNGEAVFAWRMASAAGSYKFHNTGITESNVYVIEMETDEHGLPTGTPKVTAAKLEGDVVTAMLPATGANGRVLMLATVDVMLKLTMTGEPAVIEQDHSATSYTVTYTSVLSGDEFAAMANVLFESGENTFDLTIDYAGDLTANNDITVDSKLYRMVSKAVSGSHVVISLEPIYRVNLDDPDATEAALEKLQELLKDSANLKLTVKGTTTLPAAKFVDGGKLVSEETLRVTWKGTDAPKTMEVDAPTDGSAMLLLNADATVTMKGTPAPVDPKPVVPDVPQTGDNMPIALCVALAAMSGCALLAMKKRK